MNYMCCDNIRECSKNRFRKARAYCPTLANQHFQALKVIPEITVMTDVSTSVTIHLWVISEYYSMKNPINLGFYKHVKYL